MFSKYVCCCVFVVGGLIFILLCLQPTGFLSSCYKSCRHWVHVEFHICNYFPCTTLYFYKDGTWEKQNFNNLLTNKKLKQMRGMTGNSSRSANWFCLEFPCSPLGDSELNVSVCVYLSQSCDELAAYPGSLWPSDSWVGSSFRLPVILNGQW